MGWFWELGGGFDFSLSDLSPSSPQHVDTRVFICIFVGFREDQELCVSPFTALFLHLQESTYGTHIHEKREEREARFCNTVHDIVNRGGRGLIPVFALGRAQELLLILGMTSPAPLSGRAHKETEKAFRYCNSLNNPSTISQCVIYLII